MEKYSKIIYLIRVYIKNSDKLKIKTQLENGMTSE